MDDLHSSATFKHLEEWVSSTPVDTAIEVLHGSDICVGTTRGIKRSGNEDRACFARIVSQQIGAAPYYIALVCDGMGGMRGGAECATAAISSILAGMLEGIGVSDPKRTFLEAIRGANREIFRRYSGNGGTTLVAIFVSRTERLGVSVGDSRIYSLDPTGHAMQLSVDDTIAAEVGKLSAISSAQLENLEFGEQLTQFVGIGADLRVREIDLKNLKNNKTIFLLSDGAWRSSDDVFQKIINNSPSTVETAKRIIHTANWCGGLDNTTVLALPNLERLSNLDPFGSMPSSPGRMDVWSPFGRLSVFKTEPSYPLNSVRKQNLQSEVRPVEGRLTVDPTIQQDQSSEPKVFPANKAHEYATRNDKTQPPKSGGIKLLQVKNKKSSEPKQLDIEILVHDGASTTKKPKQLKAAPKGDKGYGYRPLKKSKRTR